VMLIANDQSFMQTQTDAAGMFRLEHHSPDSTRFFVLAKNQKENENVELTLNPKIFPTLKHAPVSLTLLPVGRDIQNQPVEIVPDFITKATQRSQYDEDMRVVNLEEVEVTANRIEKRDVIRLSNPLNAASDRIFIGKTLKSWRLMLLTLDIFFPGWV